MPTLSDRSLPDDPVRFADILTTASAVADYQGQSDVAAGHLLSAIEILDGRLTLEDLGRPVSPLVPRPRQRGSEPRLRALVQRWWNDLGEDVNATLDRAALDRLAHELRALGERTPPSEESGSPTRE